MKDIPKIVKGIAGLKPIAQVANKIMEIVQNPDSSMSELSEIIAYDATATANLLKASNSAFYGRSQKFESVHQAIVFLGMDEVVDLVLMGSCSENLKQPQNGYGLPSGDLWRYSTASALMARKIAKAKAVENVHLIFTAALLKDIGKVILEQYVAESFDKIKTLVMCNGYSFREAEKSILGIDHAELGALVARVWQFSPMMIDIIGNHHQPQLAEIAKQETAVVHAGDVLCMMLGINVGVDGLAYRFDQNVMESLGINDIELQITISGFSEELQKVEELIF